MSWKKAGKGVIYLHTSSTRSAKPPTHGTAEGLNDTVMTSPKGSPDRGVTYNGKEYDEIKEGLAYILTPKGAHGLKSNKNGTALDSESQTVFYNPIQQFNRDLSVLAIRAFGEEIIAKKRRLREGGPRGSTEVVGKGRKRKRGDDGGTGVTEHSNQTAGVTVPGNIETKEQPSAATASSLTHEVMLPRASNTEKANGVAKGNADGPKDDPYQPAQVEATLAQDDRDTIRKAAPNTLKAKSASEPNPTLISNDGKAEATPTTKPPNPPFTILDALSATGLRALRYAKEIPFVTSVTANDLSAEATASIKINIQHNNLEHKISAATKDARQHMYSMSGQQSPKQPGGHAGKYDVIDLDPYGTAAPFLDSALQAIADGGLLCVTCTDSGVFASVGHLEKTFALYGGLPFRGPQSHEAGLRLVIHAVASSAARYSLAVEPLLSLSIDFYVRLFIRVKRSPAEVKFLAGKTMIVYNCDHGCGAWSTQLLASTKEQKGRKGDIYFKHSLALGPSTSELCEHCGFKTHVAGPMWAGPLHNNSFIQGILDLLPGLDESTYATIPRIEGMLNTAFEEDISAPPPSGNTPQPSTQSSTTSFIPNNPVAVEPHPFFIIPSTLSKVLHCQTPSEDELRGALKHLNYRISRSHAKPGSIRTDAPWSVIWEVMREWVRQRSPVKEEVYKKGTAGRGIMQKSRERYRVNKLQEELRKAIEKGEGIETLRTDVEAALYRASKVEHVVGEEAPVNADIEVEDSPDKGFTNSKHIGCRELSRLKVVFDTKLGREPDRKRLVRYQINPRSNWGPMTRAKAT